MDFIWCGCRQRLGLGDVGEFILFSPELSLNKVTKG